jgi:alkylhydroperoxidase/carboxymuconolactone decarboxylase family protein YurZ
MEISPTDVPPVDELHYNPVNIESWRSRGATLCRKIYGRQYESLMQRVSRMAPELSDAMIVEGYGKVLSRTELDTGLRELCVVAILIVKNRPRQLLSHSLGALRLGVHPEKIRDVLTIVDNLTLSFDLGKSKSIIEEAIQKYKLP